jgi:hypothetical protein
MTQHIETIASRADLTCPAGAESFSRGSHSNDRAGHPRQLLLSAVLLACGFYCASANAACKTSTGESSGPVIPSTLTGSGAVGEEDERSIVGVWHVCLFDDTGAVFDEGFDMWNKGGTELLNDILPPPLPPYSTGFFCEGVYVRTGPRTFKLRHPAWTVDKTGALSGTAVLLEEVTLGIDGKSFSGKFEEIFYDLDGHVVMGGDVSGTLQATRITPN